MAKPRNRTPAPTPESRATEGRRDFVTRFQRGKSGNPGGIPRAVVETRKRLMQHLESADEVLLELLEHEDWKAKAAGLELLYARTLGRVSALAELPTDTPLPSPGDDSPRALLSRALRLTERSLASAEQQVSDGQPLSEAQRSALREDAQTLSLLAKEERELSKQGGGAELSDEALVSKVLESLPLEKLEAALALKKGAP